MRNQFQSCQRKTKLQNDESFYQKLTVLSDGNEHSDRARLIAQHGDKYNILQWVHFKCLYSPQVYPCNTVSRLFPRQSSVDSICCSSILYLDSLHGCMLLLLLLLQLLLVLLPLLLLLGLQEMPFRALVVLIMFPTDDAETGKRSVAPAASFSATWKAQSKGLRAGR